jgi:hypothetical protein
LQPHRTVVRSCAWDKSRNMCISQVTGHSVQKTGWAARNSSALIERDSGLVRGRSLRPQLLDF